MHRNAELIEKFYRAFQKRDGATMASCYHPQVQFSDPVFTDLQGERAGAMWRMLTERGKDLKVEFRDVRADDAAGAAHWEAWYTFSGTGRKVHNVIDADFSFRDGLITKHVDSFDWPRWAGQALGLSGKLLGGTNVLHRKVSKKARAKLDDYLARERSN